MKKYAIKFTYQATDTYSDLETAKSALRYKRSDPERYLSAELFEVGETLKKIDI